MILSLRAVVPSLFLVIAAALAPASIARPNGGIDASGGGAAQAEPASGGDIPRDFVPPARPDQDYVRREVMIPMRDGVRLKTVLVIPRNAAGAPIILDRTPYDAGHYTALTESGRGQAILPPLHADLFQAGYIVVMQDVRGKHGSEGDYVLARPIAERPGPGAIDYATDAWDTIDWLSKNVPESNGRVGTIGISYDGYTALATLVGSHPALKAAAPIDPLVDGWKGDDWFHNGAYRQLYMEYVFHQTTSVKSTIAWPFDAWDGYEAWLKAGSAGAMAAARGMADLPAWRRISSHPAYDSYWSAQAVDAILSRRPPTVPTLIVHGQWDQEDIYGGPAVWRALSARPDMKGRLFLAIGPWNHGGSGLASGATLGPLTFPERTSEAFRRYVLIPFFDARLKDGAPAAPLAAVTAYETGTHVWRTYDRWPQSCASGCPYASRKLFLKAGGGLSFDPPKASDPASDSYVADPSKPVTFRPRPIRPVYGKGSEWSRWLTDDQRFAADRTDVLTYVSEPLSAPVRIAGAPVAHLFAATTGTDADWVVKVIDVYPYEVPGQPEMGGYQLPISMDILRGRYRDDPAHPSPIPAGKTVAYSLDLPNANHVFLPGHRIMVQIQSSWFPLYDRNPQTYVDNIFFAKPSDYVKATQTVFHSPAAASYVDLPVAP